MTLPLPDQSRDRRIEDLTNLWVVHPAARLLLPRFIARNISANAVSLGGLLIGALAALAYANWDYWPLAVIGLLLSIAWLVADGLDGMIARATGTASPLGRMLDGLCDHGVFVLIYVALAASIGTLSGWLLAVTAGIAHAVQSNLYESERSRFHRRCNGLSACVEGTSGNAIVRGYDGFAGMLERLTFRFDDALQQHTDPAGFAKLYGAEATGPMRLMTFLTANVRVFAIFIACLIGDPQLFWWFELVPLTAILVTGLLWHRAVEAKLIRNLNNETVRRT